MEARDKAISLHSSYSGIGFNRAVIDSIIISIVLFSLLIDTFNGIFLRIGLPSIGQPVRIVLLYLIFYRIFSLSRNLSLILFIVYFKFILLSFVHFYNYYNVEWLVTDFAHAHKFVGMIGIWFYFYIIIKRNLIQLNTIKRIYIFNILFLGFNLVAGMFGYGYSQYGGGIGSIGFFYAGNEVSGLMICLFTPILYYVYHKYSIKRYILVSLFLIALGFIKVTKVAILGTIIIVMMIPVISTFYGSSFWSLKRFKVIIIGLIMLVLLMYAGYFIIDEIGLLARIEHFYYVVNKGDLVTTLLSGRNQTFQAAKEAYVNNSSMIEYVCGKGVVATTNSTIPYIGVARGVEIDPVDFLFQFGFIGFIGLFITVFCMLVYCYVKYSRGKNQFAYILLVVNILLFIIASTAGHIYNSAMAGIFLGLMNSLLAYDSNQVCGKEHKRAI